jgi:hypothetical protein
MLLIRTRTSREQRGYSRAMHRIPPSQKMRKRTVELLNQLRRRAERIRFHPFPQFLMGADTTDASTVPIGKRIRKVKSTISQ